MKKIIIIRLINVLTVFATTTLILSLFGADHVVVQGLDVVMGMVVAMIGDDRARAPVEEIGC